MAMLHAQHSTAAGVPLTSGKRCTKKDLSAPQEVMSDAQMNPV